MDNGANAQHYITGQDQIHSKLPLWERKHAEIRKCETAAVSPRELKVAAHLKRAVLPVFSVSQMINPFPHSTTLSPHFNHTEKITPSFGKPQKQTMQNKERKGINKQTNKINKIIYTEKNTSVSGGKVRQTMP